MPSIVDIVLSAFVLLLFILSKIGDVVLWFVIKIPYYIIILFEKTGMFFTSFTLDVLKKVYISITRFVKNCTTLLSNIKTFISRSPASILKTKSSQQQKIRRGKLFKLKFSFTSFLLGIMLTLIFVVIPYNFFDKNKIWGLSFK